MKCSDVRRSLPLLVAGEIPLTEWALLETHLTGCEGCRAEAARLRSEAAVRSRDKRRRLTVIALATCGLLVVVGALGLFVRQNGLPGLPRPELLWFRAPTSPEAPPPAEEAAAPTPPAPVATVPPVELPATGGRPPRPAPVAAPPAPIPTVARPKPVGETVARPPRPAVAPPAPTGAATGLSAEQMPTQAAPTRMIHAAPTAESMPGQGSAPARGRQ